MIQLIFMARFSAAICKSGEGDLGLHQIKGGDRSIISASKLWSQIMVKFRTFSIPVEIMEGVESTCISQLQFNAILFRNEAEYLKSKRVCKLWLLTYLLP